MKVLVTVMLKSGVLDPQGKAIAHALGTLGFAGVEDVRAGKVLYTGVSDWPAWEVAEANTIAELRGWTPFVALQSRYNMLERTPEGDYLLKEFHCAVSSVANTFSQPCVSA